MPAALQVLAYGNARDQVLGLEVVLADGRVWDGLRALRKDNTGYDLRDLFIGAEGTLGIITAAVLRLVPAPKSKATAFAGLASLEDAARFFDLALETGAGELTAFELLPRIGIEFVLRHAEGTRDPLGAPHPWYALIELAEPARRRGAGAGRGAAGAGGRGGDRRRCRARGLAGPGGRVLAAARDAFGGAAPRGRQHQEPTFPCRSPRCRSSSRRAIDAVTAIVPDCRPVPFGHYGDGNIHFNISQPVGADKAAFLARWPR